MNPHTRQVLAPYSLSPALREVPKLCLQAVLPMLSELVKVRHILEMSKTYTSRTPELIVLLLTAFVVM